MNQQKNVITLGNDTSLDQSSHRSRAVSFAETGQWEDALAQCRSAIEQNQADWDMHILRGDLLLRLHRWEQAANSYQKALSARPDMLVLNHKIAIALAQLGKISEADDRYAQFLSLASDLEQDTDDFIAQRQAGDFFFRQNALSRAKVAYQRAVELEPEDCWVRINLSRVLYRLGQEKPAISMFRKAIAADPQNFAAYYHLATVLFELSNYTEAENLCRQALEIDPQNELVSHLVNQIASAKDEHSSNSPAELTNIGAEERLILESSLKSDTKAESFQFHYQAGQQLSTEKRWEAATAAYQRSINLNADFYLAHYDLGNAFTHLERWAEAVAAYQKALALNPNLHHVANRLNQAIAQQQQRQPAAIRHPLEALSTDFHNPILHVELADAFYRYSFLNDAISHYRTALDLIGSDHTKTEVIEQKLEVAIARRTRLERAFYEPVVIPADYAAWVTESAPSLEELALMPAKIVSFKHKPTISILVPIYNPPEPVLREMIQSVLDQIYPYWELCLADDCSTASHVKPVLEEYARLDSRIKLVFCQQNGHISAASNSAMKVATGEYIGLLDHDDELTPHALYEVVALINRHPEADMIYSDEDKRSLIGERTEPYFKPDWSPDTFLSRMYICHFGIYRRQIFEEIGGFRIGMEGSQDYDLVLRFTEKTQNIFHIPKILYHWRVIESSVTSGAEAKPYAYEAAVKALEEALVRRGEPGRIEMSKLIPGIYIPRYEIQEYKLVSIIIPTRNLGQMLDVCLKSIFEKTTYPNYEVVLLDNGSDEPESLNIIQGWKEKEPKKFKHILYDVPFNYSSINNYAASQASGDFFLFLNNDTEIITPDWIEGMVEQAQRSSIGAVGAKLYYEDDTLQHGGVVLGIGDAAGHSHRHFPRDSYGYVGQLIAVNNYSAVTAACLMCRKEVFESVGGFEEALSVAFNDVELCIRIQDAGYNNVWLPHVELYHYESKSRGYEDTPEKTQRLQREASILRDRWGSVIANDPCYSPHLTRQKEDYSIKAVPYGEISAIEQPENHSSHILKSCLDLPRIGKCTAIIQVSGWVIGQTSAIETVAITSNGLVISETSLMQKRADVLAAYPNSEFSLLSGFQLQLSILGFSSGTKLHVEVGLSNGKSVRIGSFSVTTPVKELTHSSRLDLTSVVKERSLENNRQFIARKPLVSVKSVVVDIYKHIHLVSKLCVDSPSPCTAVEEITLAGWIVGPHPIKFIGLFQNGAILEKIAVNIPRIDVEKAHPEKVKDRSCGFKTQLLAKVIDRTYPKIEIKAFVNNDCIEVGRIILH